MANVVIDDSSLYAIGDALREKLGESHIKQVYVETIHHPETTKQMTPKIAKTPNATGFSSFSGAYANSLHDTQTITVEGATNLLIDFAYQTESTSYDYLMIGSSSTRYGGSTLTRKSVVVSGDTVEFTFRSDSSQGNYLGYYAEVLGLDADGSILQEVIPAWDEEIYEDVEVPHIYKPRDMADAIVSIKGQMSYVTLTRKDDKSFDISPYVSEGDNFILYFSQAMGDSTGSSVYNSIYTSFFSEDEKQYKHRLNANSYNRNGINKWSESGSATSSERAPAIATTITSIEGGTGWDTVTITYENGIITNSNLVGTSAILVYPC